MIDLKKTILFFCLLFLPLITRAETVEEVLGGYDVKLVRQYNPFYGEDAKAMDEFIFGEFKNMVEEHGAKTSGIVTQQIEIDPKRITGFFRKNKYFVLQSKKEKLQKQFLEDNDKGVFIFCFPLVGYSLVNEKEQKIVKYSSTNSYKGNYLDYDSGVKLLGFDYYIYMKDDNGTVKEFKGIFSLERDHNAVKLTEKVKSIRSSVGEHSTHVSTSHSKTYSYQTTETIEDFKQRFVKYLNSSFKFKKKTDQKYNSKQDLSIPLVDLFSEITEDNMSFLIAEDDIALVKANEILFTSDMFLEKRVIALPAGDHSFWFQEKGRWKSSYNFLYKMMFSLATLGDASISGVERKFGESKKVDIITKNNDIVKVIEKKGKYKFKKFNKKAVLYLSRDKHVDDEAYNELTIDDRGEKCVAKIGSRPWDRWLNKFKVLKVKTGYYAISISRFGVERFVIIRTTGNKRYNIIIDDDDLALKKVRVEEENLSNV